MYFGENVIYIYDGTFDGMMCCVFESVLKREVPYEIMCEEDFSASFFSVSKIITDKQKALRVYNSIAVKMGDVALDLIQTMYLSCAKNKEMNILNFMLLGYKHGFETVKMMSHVHVTPMLCTHKAVKSEAHHFKGFARFANYDGALVAFISPKNFVLPYLRQYFCARYKDDDFFVFDKTHKVALIYEKGKADIISVDSITTPDISDEEQQYRDLWVRYYKTVAIEERENPKCRMTLMPKRFWQDMVEMQDEIKCLLKA